MTDESVIVQEPQPEIMAPPPKAPKNWAKISLFFIALGLAVALAAFAIGYFQLAKQQMDNIRNFVKLDQIIKLNQAHIQTLDQSLQTLNDSMQKYQTLAQQQEQTLHEWQTLQKGEMQVWQRKEAEYLVKLANDQLQLNHNVEAAIILLQQADQILQQINDANILSIRQAIANNLTTLQSLPKVDVTNLYLKLVALDQQADELPLPSNPLSPNAPTLTNTENMPWWRRGLHEVGQALGKMIIIKRIDQSSSPLVLPDEKVFLYQNLHARMAQALWALLNRNQAIYQTNLARIQSWIQTYFKTDEAITQHFLQSLQELQNVHLEIPTLDLNTTVQMFETNAQPTSA